jgi:mono/diheme cytochrome c family protein
LLLSALAAVFALGCQETIKKESPIHPNWNMDQTVRIDAQEPAPKDIFADGRGMRTPVAGTIAVGHLRADDHFWRGQVNGDYAETLPSSLTLDADFVARGRDRFEIYCTPCHGDGHNLGPVAAPGRYPGVAVLSGNNGVLPLRSDGSVYTTVIQGRRVMPSYGWAMDDDEVWSLVHHLRTLPGASYEPPPVEAPEAEEEEVTE